MQLTPSLIYCSYLVIQSKKLRVIFKKVFIMDNTEYNQK